MSKAGLKKGWTKQSNKLKHRLWSYPFTGAQHRVLNLLDRMTAGFHQQVCSTSTSGISKLTGLSKRTVRRVLKELKEMGVIFTWKDEWKTTRVSFNHPDNWGLVEHSQLGGGGFVRLPEKGLDDCNPKPEREKKRSQQTLKRSSMTGERSQMPPFKDTTKDNIKDRGGEAASQEAEHPTPSDQPPFIILECPYCHKESAWADYEQEGIKDDQPLFKCPECLYRVHIMLNPTTLQPEIFEADQDQHGFRKTRSPSPARSLEGSPTRPCSEISSTKLECPFCESNHQPEEFRGTVVDYIYLCPTCESEVEIDYEVDRRGRSVAQISMPIPF